MAALNNTLLLDLSTWDLVTDISGNIAVAGPPYSQVQDAASAIRLFLSELYYDMSQGIPYRQSILGQWPPISLLRMQLEAAALSVPGVITAAVFFSSFTDRTVTGQVQITNGNGQTATASF